MIDRVYVLLNRFRPLPPVVTASIVALIVCFLLAGERQAAAQGTGGPDPDSSSSQAPASRRQESVLPDDGANTGSAAPNSEDTGATDLDARTVVGDAKANRLIQPVERTGYKIYYGMVYSRVQEGDEVIRLYGDLYVPLPDSDPKKDTEPNNDTDPNNDTEPNKAPAGQDPQATSRVSPDQPQAPLPVVLLLHGGAWTTGNKFQMLLHAKKLTRRGYAAFAINYRLAPDHPFPAQIYDCKSAVRWLRRNADDYRLDANRVAVYGYSAGAHLACMLGTTVPSDGMEGDTKWDVLNASDDGSVAPPPHAAVSTRVQVVVGGGSPCDFRGFPLDMEFLSYWLGGTRREYPRRYETASPITFVTPDDAPVFLFHGSSDSLVPLASPLAMKKRLDEVGVRSEIFVCKGKGHVVTFMDKDATSAAIDFLDSVLQPGKNGAGQPGERSDAETPEACPTEAP